MLKKRLTLSWSTAARQAIQVGAPLFFGAVAVPAMANEREIRLVYEGIRKVYPDMSAYCALSSDAKRAAAIDVVMELAGKRRLSDPMTAGPAASIRLRQECGEDASGVSVASARWTSTYPALQLDVSAKPHQPGEPARRMANSLRVPHGTGPFPAVVLSHTIGGVSEHSTVFAEQLLNAGYAVLVLDSMGPRNIQPGSRILPSEGVKDAYDALSALAGQPLIDTSRIFQVGHSWGAFVSGMLSSPAGAQTFKSSLRYRASVGHYGTCSFSTGPQASAAGLEIETASADLDRPLLMLMAADDIETPPERCFPMLERLKAQGRPVDWHIYPGVTHGWDKRENHGYVYRTGQGQAMTYRYDAVVTANSIRRTIDFLESMR